jgi:hypothetical protein
MVLPTAAFAEEPAWSEATVGKSLSFEGATKMAKENIQILLDRGQHLFTSKFTTLGGVICMKGMWGLATRFEKTATFKGWP